MKIFSSFPSLDGSSCWLTYFNAEGDGLWHLARYSDGSAVWARWPLSSVAFVKIISEISVDILLLQTADNRLQLFNTKSGLFHADPLYALNETIDSIAISTDSSRLIVASNCGNIYLININNHSIHLLIHGFGDVKNGCVDWMLREEFEVETGLCWLSDDSFIYLSTNYQAVEFVAIDHTGYLHKRYSFAGCSKLPRYSLRLCRFGGLDIRSDDCILDLDGTGYLLGFQCFSGHVYYLICRRDQRHVELIRHSLETGERKVVWTSIDKYFHMNLFFIINGDFLVSYFGKLRCHTGRETIEFEHVHIVKFIGLSVSRNRLFFLHNTGYRHELGYFDIYSKRVNLSVYKGHCISAMMLNSENVLVQTSSFSGEMKVLILDLKQTSYIEHPQFININEIIPNSVDRVGFEIEARTGELLYGIISYPEDFVSSKKYPLILLVYGGPRIQNCLASNDSGFPQTTLQFQRMGYIVVTLDCRGTANRGYAFEDSIRFKIPRIQIEDYMDLLNQYLLKFEYIDANNVNLHGWSFGGYLALKMAEMYPRMFNRISVGAPVVIWNYYDAAYTERYLGLYSENSYQDASVSLSNDFIAEFKKLPEKRSFRILIVTGGLDDNVLCMHSFILKQLLEMHDVPHLFHVYEDEGHGIQKPDNFKHYNHMQVEFFRN